MILTGNLVFPDGFRENLNRILAVMNNLHSWSAIVLDRQDPASQSSNFSFKPIMTKPETIAEIRNSSAYIISVQGAAKKLTK